MTFDYQKTIISQYAASNRLRELIADFDDCLKPSANVDRFYDLVWNIQTAQGYGLDLWGRILGVTRVLEVVPEGYFGWDQGDRQTWGHGPWFGNPATPNYRLSDDAYRVLLYARALANLTDCSIQSLNRLLTLLFPEVKAYVTDGLDMTMTYHFSPSPSPVELAIINQTGVLPKPVGVAATVVIV